MVIVAEFRAVGLVLVVEEPGSHYRWLLLHFHVKYGPKEQSQNICSGLEANAYPPDVTQGSMNAFFLRYWQGGNRGKEARSRGNADEIKETL